MVTSFPFGNGLIEASFQIFRGSTETLIQFIPLIFLLRLVVTKATFGGARDYGDLLKELLFLYVGFFVFQEVMEMVMKAPEIANHMLKNPDPVMISKKDKGWIEWIVDLWAVDIVNMISSLIYWLVCFCYLVMMAFMITIGAYIILFSTMFRMQWMIKAYMSLVLILSIWPFVWYSVDQSFVFVIKGLEGVKHNNGVIIAKILGGIMKLSVPIIGAMSAMKAPVAAAMSLASSVKEGSLPLLKMGQAGLNVSKGVGKALGFDRAVESFRSDPIKTEERRIARDQNRRFRLNDAAPALAYSIQKKAHAFKNRNSLERNHEKFESFKEFSEKQDRKLHQRNVIKTEKKLSSGKVTDIQSKSRLIHSQESSLRSLSRSQSFQIDETNKTKNESQVNKKAVFSEVSKKSVLNDERFRTSFETPNQKTKPRRRWDKSETIS